MPEAGVPRFTRFSHGASQGPDSRPRAQLPGTAGSPGPGRAAVRPPPSHSPARPAALRVPQPPPQAASRLARAPRPRPGRLHPVAPRAPAASWPRASVRTAAGMLRAVGGRTRAGAGVGQPAAVASCERRLRGPRAGPAGAL